MVDQAPSNDPLDRRLRATFAAEHADIERRHLANEQTTSSTRSLKWIPFAVAAAVIAIAGFAFIGNRSNDQAVELDVAAQTPDDATLPSTTDPVRDAEPDDQGEPTAVLIPYRTGQNGCGDFYQPGPAVVVWAGVANPPALTQPEISGEIGVTRTLELGTEVELTGGCARTQTADEILQWYEIIGPPGQSNDWILSNYLSHRLESDPIVPAQNDCNIERPDEPHFVWDVGIDDPDGGLIAHTEAGVDTPATRIINFDEVVAPTGGCTLASNGAPWYELFDRSGGTDWVNAQFLRATQTACLTGEQNGFILRNGQLVHRVDVGDTPEVIAAEYNIAVEELVAANPIIEIVMAVDDRIWIPGAAGFPIPIFGPIDGQAVVDGDRIAFNHEFDDEYRWYSTDGIDVGTGCSTLTGEDTFDAQPCMRVAPSVRSSADDPLQYLAEPGGDPDSTADHVHDLRTETNDTCTRIVVAFGDNVHTANDMPSVLLPPVIVEQGLDFVRITANGWQLDSGFAEADRVDYPAGIGLVTISPGYTLGVDLLHREMEPNVRFLDEPARVVIDLFPIENPDPPVFGPFGTDFVLRQPIQEDTTGPGIAVDNEIVVNGFGRPFEAAGLYRIWSVPGDVDAEAFLADPPEPLIEDFFPTTGWAEGWGTFSVDLPELEPGTYIAVFGELPPTDEIGFYGAGQLFRVADATAPDPGTWPEAVLLPNVQLPPE